MSASVANFARSRSRRWWIAAAMVALNEVRGLVVVYFILRGWGYL